MKAYQFYRDKGIPRWPSLKYQLYVWMERYTFYAWLTWLKVRYPNPERRAEVIKAHVQAWVHERHDELYD